LAALVGLADAVIAQQHIDAPPHPHSIILPEANRPPDANDQLRMRDQLTRKRSYEAANLERKRQIDEDSAKLLKLALHLKAEMERSTGNELSAVTIIEAEEIERLAHNVKEKMKLTVGAN